MVDGGSIHVWNCAAHTWFLYKLSTNSYCMRPYIKMYMRIVHTQCSDSSTKHIGEAHTYRWSEIYVYRLGICFFFYIPPFLLFVYLCLVFWASFPCPSHSALFLFLIPAIGSHIYTHSFHSHHSPYFFIRILISFILLFIYFFNFNSSAQTKFNMIFFKSGCDRISAFFLSYSTGNLFSMLLSSLSLGRLILRRK